MKEIHWGDDRIHIVQKDLFIPFDDFGEDLEITISALIKTILEDKGLWNPALERLDIIKIQSSPVRHYIDGDYKLVGEVYTQFYIQTYKNEKLYGYSFAYVYPDKSIREVADLSDDWKSGGGAIVEMWISIDKKIMVYV